MAAFTSTQNGDWNDGATWGNTSPGVKGTDWPGNAADTFSVGHTVTYNVSETNELGDSTITNGGILTFKTDGDTKIAFGNNTLTINNGGELRVGASGAVIDDAQTAELIWNTTSDDSKGIQVDDGGKLTIYGDPAYYGSDGETTLANDADNTDDDNSIVTSDDMSSKWNVGDEITIKRENDGDSTSYKDAVVKYVVKGISGTTITLKDDEGNDENFTGYDAGIGDTWTAPVVNVTRNVKLTKSGADIACGDGSTHYNTNRPKISDSNSDGNENCVISNAMITGFYSIDSDHDFQFLDSTFRNGEYGFYFGSGHTISGSVYGNYHGFYYGSGHTVSGSVYGNYYGVSSGSGHTISGSVYGNYHGFRYSSGHTVSGSVYGNYYGFYYGSGHTVSGNLYDNYHLFYYGSGYTVSGNVYGNYYGFRYGSGHTVSGRIGYDVEDASDSNTKDFDGCAVDIVLLNAKLPSGGLVIDDIDTDGLPTEIFCEHHDRTLNAQRIYWNMGNATKVSCDDTDGRPSEDPDGGSGDVIELSNIQTGCDSDLNNTVKAWKPHTYRIWATSAAGQKNYKFYVQTTYSGISAGGLKLTAEYLDGVSAGSTSEVIDSSAITVRSSAADWTQELNVDVNPSEDGWIDFMIELQEYEFGDEVWIWPEVEIT